MEQLDLPDALVLSDCLEPLEVQVSLVSLGLLELLDPQALKVPLVRQDSLAIPEILEELDHKA